MDGLAWQGIGGEQVGTITTHQTRVMRVARLVAASRRSTGGEHAWVSLDIGIAYVLVEPTAKVIRRGRIRAAGISCSLPKICGGKHQPDERRSFRPVIRKPLMPQATQSSGRNNHEVGTIGDRHRCRPPRGDQSSECWVQLAWAMGGTVSRWVNRSWVIGAPVAQALNAVRYSNRGAGFPAGPCLAVVSATCDRNPYHRNPYHL
jgi:hypothetical protein